MSQSRETDQEGQDFVLVDEQNEAETDGDVEFEQALPEMPLHACSNCGSDLNGHFCAICGQPNKEIRRPFYILLAEMIHVLLDLDGRAYRSIFLLFTRPAFLSNAFISGRRANYTAPLRLFLAISITFFIFISVQNTFESLRESMNEIEAAALNETIEGDAEVVDQAESAVRSARDRDADVASLGDDLDWLMPLIDRINLPFASEQSNANLHTVLRQQAEENYIAVREDPTDAVMNALEYITVFILLMIPILAFMQFVVFFLAKRFFIEHLVLTLHNHTFIVLAFLLLTLLGIVEDSGLTGLNAIAGIANSLIVLWIPIYLLLSLKFFFGWGWLATTSLYIVTSIAYAIVMGVGIATFTLALFLLS